MRAGYTRCARRLSVCPAWIVGGVLAIAPAAGAVEEDQVVVEAPKDAAVQRGHPVSVELIAEHTSLRPGGATQVGVHFEIEPGWHIYAEEPGDAGLPTKVSWTTPEPGESTRMFDPLHLYGPLRWPSPERFLDQGDIRTFGYAGDLVLASALSITSGVAPGEVFPIRAEVEWLACKELCVPGSAQLQLELPVRHDPPERSEHAGLFERSNE